MYVCVCVYVRGAVCVRLCARMRSFAYMCVCVCLCVFVFVCVGREEKCRVVNDYSYI